MTAVAVIGFGDMGQQMVPHLLTGGYRVTVFDSDAQKLQNAASLGAAAAVSAADAAANAEVVLGLVMSEDIPQAYLSDRGILAGSSAGTVVLVASTTTPTVLEQVRTAAPDGVQVLDTPIVGGVAYAREAAVTFLVGSDQFDDSDQVSQFLSTLGKVRHVGGVGSATAYKLITNVAIMAAEAGIREALDLADELGQDYDTALDLMSVGPMAAVVSRALDTTNPRPLRRSAEDDDTLLSAVGDPATVLPISHAGAQRLWEAVNATPDFEPDFIDLTRKTTARPAHRTQ